MSEPTATGPLVVGYQLLKHLAQPVRRLAPSGLAQDLSYSDARAPFYVTSASYGVYVETQAQGYCRVAVQGKTGFQFWGL